MTSSLAGRTGPTDMTWRLETLRETIEHWSRRIDETDMGCDWADAHERCWRCGVLGHVKQPGEGKRLEKCHLIPKACGGSDHAPNVIPLCKRCHLEQPDVAHTQATFDWIARTRGTFDGTLYLERDVLPVLLPIFEKAELEADHVSRALTLAFEAFREKKACVHFAPWGAYIKPSTYEHLVRAAVDAVLAENKTMCGEDWAD